jgi:hypothetical protein
MKACVIRIPPSIFYELLQLPDAARIVEIKTDIYCHGDLLIKLVGVGDEIKEGQCLSEIRACITRLSSGQTLVNWQNLENSGGAA